MRTTIICRQEEIEILEALLQSNESELLAIYGRRRVGKTFLIKNYYSKSLSFSCSGQYLAKTKEQLINFAEQLATFFPDKKMAFAPGTWQEAFRQLNGCIDAIGHKRKKVIFFDEVPWLDSHKSGFLASFSYFWNMFASQRKDLLVVICGSAASWIIEKVINNKGGLHNRVTQRVRLLPFTLSETELYLQSRNIQLERYQLLQLYMVMGGIPMYLNAIEAGKSAAQNIDKICFSKDGALTNEFNNLYAALFNSADKHIQVIKALARKNKGLTRKEVLEAGNLMTGGAISTILNELAESGFIEKNSPFENEEKNALYRLSDQFSLFYFRFMQTRQAAEKGQWIYMSITPTYTNWCGYAFENICFMHIQQIRKALQIAGMQSSASCWHKAGTRIQEGTQIDLLIDRADRSINVCEMKFSFSEFTITKKYAAALKQKLTVFKDSTKTRKVLFLTMITTYGVTKNIHYTGLVQNQLTMDAFFKNG